MREIKVCDQQPVKVCPRCHTALDEGPIVYRCAHCRRTVYAADVDTEYHAPLATTGAAQ